jgi:GntR family transcriptional repressor for pyruvate dehydrogenase complex
MNGGSTKETEIYKPLKRGDGLAQQVSKQILEMISDGELTPGDKLPAERTLAEQLGVSRNVLREAVRSLASLNVLEVRHGAGVFVGSLEIADLIEPLEFAVSLERSAVKALLEARQAMEPGIARLAAERIGSEQIAALRRLVHESDEHGGDPSRFLEIDVELHGMILGAADNPFLTRIMQSVGRLARTGREFTNPSPSMREVAIGDHHEIVTALELNDGDAAEAAMRRHLVHVAETLEVEPTSGEASDG